MAGVRLGASKASVITALGRPDNDADRTGAVVWHYRTRGVDLAISDERGVELMRTTLSGGELDGVRVGDPLLAAETRWGEGRRSGDFVRFDRGGWLATVRTQQGVIREISAAPR